MCRIELLGVIKKARQEGLSSVPTRRDQFSPPVQERPAVGSDNAKLLGEAQLAPLRSAGISGGFSADRPADIKFSLLHFQVPDVLRQFCRIGVPFMSEARLVVGVALFECAFHCSKVVHAIVAPCRFHGGLVYDLRCQAIS